MKLYFLLAVFSVSILPTKQILSRQDIPNMEVTKLNKIWRFSSWMRLMSQHTVTEHIPKKAALSRCSEASEWGPPVLCIECLLYARHCVGPGTER